MQLHRFTPSVNMSANRSRSLAMLLFVATMLLLATVDGKHVHHRAHHRRAAGDEAGKCDTFFDKLNVSSSNGGHHHHIVAGPICGGHCCDSTTEQELTSVSSNQFANNLRIHTQNLRSTLEKTAETFKDYLLNLTNASENKTLTVFNTVYQNMSPLSRHPIVELYQQIKNHIIGHTEFDFDIIVSKFFSTLFPVAYHRAIQAVESTPSESSELIGDFHPDYKTCLRQTYEDLQPFGHIPKELTVTLQNSLSTSNLFVTALERASDILASTEDITADALSTKCRQHLLKMTYCSKCKAIEVPQSRSCYGYCTNVLRGCLAQYVGVLDSPWTKVAEAIDKLWHDSVRSNNGAEEVLKSLDGHLSSAIMYTMNNAQELEKKVKKACGNPTLLPVDKNSEGTASELSTSSGHHPAYKSMTQPADTEMLRFMVDIFQSKDFYAKIVNRVCEDGDDFTRMDSDCWTGNEVGTYAQTVPSNVADAQRYNPEVPLEVDLFGRATRLSELVDKLIKLRSTIEKPSNLAVAGGALASAYSDMQSDMGSRHYDDDAGDGGGSAYPDGNDDEYDDEMGSGENGSGYGATTPDITDADNRDTSNVTTAPGAAPAGRHATPVLIALAAVLAVLALAKH